MRPGKTWIVMGTALGIGLVAALLARSYLSSRLAEIEARARGATVNLIVAKRELRKGELITEETVAIRPVPQDYAHSQALSPEQFDRVAGQAVAYPMKSGEMLLWSMVEGKRVPTFSTRVGAGRRALTVPVDEINSISGLLEPGDTIDLIASIEQKGRKQSFLLQQGIQVLATGQRSVDDPKSGERRTYSTVTLDTTPAQAQTIISARDAGKLTAMLRNPEDKQALITGEAAANFMRLAIGQSAEIPVLYGGRSGKIPPEGLRLSQYSRFDSNETPIEASASASVPVIKGPNLPQQ
ncbi:MAG: Flp pilus assembly protein CpaB [Betaproteobacteria bacterium]|nr:Flp pilus assembly protein CpaB [Betaproteobacteria bacterium]